MTLSKMIKQLCKQNNITLKQLCFELNYNYDSIKSQVNSNKLSAKKLLQIAKFFNVNVQPLLEAQYEME